jgi:putative nucleotidyltransferase with HDIG domain
MHDRTSELENNHELKFSREQSFFDKSLGIRLAIGLAFIVCLFAILHFREERVEVLELNTIAPGYSVAQVDFDFFDEEATIILKQEALRDVGKILKLPENQVRQRRSEYENFLISNQEWRKAVENASLEEMYLAMDLLEKALTKLRFTDPRTLQKMKRVSMPVSHVVLFAPTNRVEEQYIPNRVWSNMVRDIFEGQSISPSAIAYLTNYFEGKPWRFEEDIPIERNLRRRLQAEVPDKYTHVGAGSRIIDQGERVTTRHIAMFQAMKKALGEKHNLWHPLTLMGSLMLAALLTAACGAYLYINHPQVLLSNRQLFLLVTLVVLTMGLAKITELFLLSSKSNLIEIVRYPIIVPFAAILLTSLMNASIATFACGFLIIILAIALSFDREPFMIVNFTAALVAILSTRSLRHRKEVFAICGKAWIFSLLAITAIHFYKNTINTSLPADVISSVIFMLLTAVLVVGLLPLLESGFRIMTDVTLMEYMDPNNDLLRRLALEAPGTYQHSIVVGNLTEAAAAATGANGLFCRVATLYHDIGKIVNPQYFTENQMGGMNIHQLLTPQESAQVIIAHVSEGVAIARKAGLPEQFIDIIKEHHGTTLAYYFYRKQLDLVGGDKSLVDEKEFRYAGPKPRSKESAIIMIADSLEAASRSLDKMTELSLMELANRLVKDKADDGQFDQCLLTFEELAIVKETLVKTLVAYGHARVKYPSRELQRDSSQLPEPNDES